MPSPVARLPQLLTELQTALALQFPALTFFTGERHLRTNGVPPQIVFVPRPTTFGPPEKKTNNPRSLWTENTPVDVHIWGASFDDADAIKVAVLQTVYAMAYGSVSPDGSDPTEPDNLTQGHAIRLSLTFLTPVTDRVLTTVIPTTFVVTPGTAGDGILEMGES